MSAETENKIYCATSGKFIVPPVAGTLVDKGEYQFTGPCSECSYQPWLKQVDDAQFAEVDATLQLIVRIADLAFLERAQKRSGLSEGLIIMMCTTYVNS